MTRPALKVIIGGADDRAGGRTLRGLEVTSIGAAHLDHLRQRNLAVSTIAQRRYALLRLARFTGQPPIVASTEDLLAFRWRLTRAGRPLEAQSQAGELAHLAGFFKWAVMEGHRPDDPMLKVPRPRLPRGMPNPISEDDLSRAIATARDRIRPWFFLAAFAGLRAFEIAPLRGEDLWWHTDPPLLIVRHGKGGDAGTVPIGPELGCALLGMPRRGWCFPGEDGGPVKAHTVSHLANDHLHRLGIAHTLHSLRHRFGTQVLRASHGDLRQTQELMRHASINSTVRYTLVDQSDKAGIVAALPTLRHLHVA